MRSWWTSPRGHVSESCEDKSTLAERPSSGLALRPMSEWMASDFASTAARRGGLRARRRARVLALRVPEPARPRRGRAGRLAARRGRRPLGRRRAPEGERPLGGRGQLGPAGVREADASTAGLAARTLRRVFTIETDSGLGAGFAAWTEGGVIYVITANHVVADARSPFVTVSRRVRPGAGRSSAPTRATTSPPSASRAGRRTRSHSGSARAPTCPRPATSCC